MSTLPLGKTIQIPRSMTFHRQLQQTILDKVDSLEQEILQTPGQTKDPLEALKSAYEQLSEQQKISFILAGGVAQLLRNRQQRRYPSQEKRRASRGTDTGELPVLC